MTTFAAAIVFGTVLVILSHRLKLSAIVLLLIGGVALGPSGIGLVHPEALGDGLKTIITVAVGLILFEGGLTLDPAGYRQASREIVGLLTRGVLITWVGAALCIRLVMGEAWSTSILAASLIIVTGPTVIGPLLRRTRVKPKLHHILHWEGVLIDPIGVFIALLCFEWLISGGETALAGFSLRILIGLGMGVGCGLLISTIILRQVIPKDNHNNFALASAVGILALSEWLRAESGLLSVTVAGFVVGWRCHGHVEGVRRYKEEMTELLIGMLFILLAAKLDVAAFGDYGWRGILVVCLIMFVIRPLNIWLSTVGPNLATNERLFLSWVAPRGIVAASMASLFALQLAANNRPGSGFLEVFTYSVIIGTVFFQGLSAPMVGKLLGVVQPKPRGWLVVGAHPLAIRIAAFIQECGLPVLLADTNGRNVAQARRQGLTAICDNALSMEFRNHPELYGTGNVLAITPNQDLNLLVCQRLHKVLPQATLYRWSSEVKDEMQERELLAGISIWENLDLPRIVTLEADEAGGGIVRTNGPIAKLRHLDRTLLMFADDNLRVLPPNPDDLESKEVACLRFMPLATPLAVNLNPDWVVVSDAKTLDDLLSELLARLKHTHPQLDADDLHRRLMLQEQEYSFLVGYEVGLPHAYTGTLNQSSVVVAKLNTPMPCAHTGNVMRFIFLVISPEGEPKKHLAALSEISRFIMNDASRQAMHDAQTAPELYRLLAPQDGDGKQ